MQVRIMVDGKAGIINGGGGIISSNAYCSHGGIYSVNPNLVKVDFSSNVNPLGISKKALKSIQKNAARLSSLYPDPECIDLKKSLLDYLDVGLGLECITVGNGSAEIIHDFARAFVRNKVIIPAPTFCEYELASKRSGAGILFVPLKNLTLDAELIIEKAKNLDAVFLCNPNNPTGLFSVKRIKKIIESIGSSTKILIDECFIEFIDDDGHHHHHSMINKIKEFDNLVILRSLTKSFGLAGLRVGYSISSPKLVKQLSANRIPWNVNGLAQMAGIIALKDLKHLKKARAMIKKERKFMQSKIEKKMQSFTPCKSDVNYFLIHLKNKNSTKIRDSILTRSRVLVRDCSTFTGMNSEYIRVAVKTHRENLLLLDALESIDDR
jgi:threonine-phosphate decarboxylase